MSTQHEIISAESSQPTAPPDFSEHVRRHGSLRRGVTRTLQVNIGKRCNLACHHCHVESGPLRKEAMDERTAIRILELLDRNPGVEVLDLTGGAPELNPHFRRLVSGAHERGLRVLDRCNLTVLFEPGQEDTAEFLAANEVEIVASLPCHQADNVDEQRGRGVFDKSIEALLLLGSLGYGRAGSGLVLDLVYNPIGDSLPPDSSELEAQYHDELARRFGIAFNRLLTLTNMPIKRFAHDLEREGRYDAYISLLVNHFNPATLPGLMCRNLLSVAYDGSLWDCDFNQQLELAPPSGPLDLWQVEDFRELTGNSIATGHHCFGCTAGVGSGCGGALVREREERIESAG